MKFHLSICLCLFCIRNLSGDLRGDAVWNYDSWQGVDESTTGKSDFYYMLMQIQVADPVFIDCAKMTVENYVEFLFHLTSHSRCPWASPLRGSWWRTRSPRRSSPATPSPSMRWAFVFATLVNDQPTFSHCHSWGQEPLIPIPLQAFTSQFHRVKIQQASARAGEAEPERNETRKKVGFCH